MALRVRLETVGLMKTHHFQMAKSISEVFESWVWSASFGEDRVKTLKAPGPNNSFVAEPGFELHNTGTHIQGLKLKSPTSFADPVIKPLLECDWKIFVSSKRKELRGEMWQFSGNVLCFVEGCLLGDEKALYRYAEEQWHFKFHRPQALYAALAEEYYINHLHSTRHAFVYMDVEIGGVVVGRILFELFTELCPKACQNFKALCTGDTGTSESGLLLSYKGSLFHRVVPKGWVQGGDISPLSKGNGGESIYGSTFEDECFAVSHNKRGILGMANQGPHSNGSQFYITLQPALWMDRKYVAFGQVVEGTEVLTSLEEVPTYNERPTQDCRVTACGSFLP